MPAPLISSVIVWRALSGAAAAGLAYAAARRWRAAQSGAAQSGASEADASERGPAPDVGPGVTLRAEGDGGEALFAVRRQRMVRLWGRGPALEIDAAAAARLRVRARRARDGGVGR
ncbi:MAG: hypothetical protein AAFW46_13545 [Pseudomonadota bacterium]